MDLTPGGNEKPATAVTEFAKVYLKSLSPSYLPYTHELPRVEISNWPMKISC